VVRTAEAPPLGTDGGLTVTIPAATSAPLDTAAEPAATSSSPSVPTTAPALPGVPAAAAGVATAPPAPVVSAAPVSAPAAVDPVALADQVLTTVTPLRRGPDGTHVLTMRLDPGHLGPVTVVAEVKGGAIRLELIAAVPAAQKALEQAAGDLRRDLADAGFGSASVDVRSGGPGDPRAGFAGGGDRSDGRSAQGSTRGADAGVGPAYESRGDRTADSQAVRYGPGGQRAVDVRV
jgi:flagellar hook-length control protein FliK